MDDKRGLEPTFRTQELKYVASWKITLKMYEQNLGGWKTL